MRNSTSACIFLLFIAVCFSFSCKQKNTDRYAYDLNRDTIPPALSITVPVNLDNYLYGEDIHIVGTATDLESKNYIRENAGKLKSLYLNISIVDAGNDTVIKKLLERTPNVDGSQGYIINEKTYVASGVGTTHCRFTGVAVDYADHKDSVVRHFTIH